MNKWKNSADMQRFKRSLEQALEKLEDDAFKYCYAKEPGYRETVNYLKNQITILEEQIKDKLW